MAHGSWLFSRSRLATHASNAICRIKSLTRVATSQRFFFDISVADGRGVPPKFDPSVMREFVGVWGWFRSLAERRP